MKIYIALIVLLCSVCTVAHENIVPSVSVMGVAEKQVVPDITQWHVFVENKASELELTSTQHTKIVKQVLNTIKANDIKEKGIQTTGMQFGENLVYRNNSRIKEGYVASTNIHFDLMNMDAYESLWSDLSKIDGVSVRGVSYDHSKRKYLEDQVRIQALMNAKKKAKSMAMTMDMSLGGTLSISEFSSSPVGGSNNMLMSMARDGESSSVSLGTIKIYMTMYLVMALEDKQ